MDWEISLKNQIYLHWIPPQREILFERGGSHSEVNLQQQNLTELTEGTDPTRKRICSEGLIGYKIYNSILSHHHHNYSTSFQDQWLCRR